MLFFEQSAVTTYQGLTIQTVVLVRKIMFTAFILLTIVFYALFLFNILILENAYCFNFT